MAWSNYSTLPTIALAIAWAVLVSSGLSACSSRDGDQDVIRSITVTVKDDAATIARLAGFEVELPPGATLADTMTVAVRESPHMPPPSIVPMGPAVQVTLGDGQELLKPAVVRFRNDPSLDTATKVPVVMWEDGQGGWEALPTSASKDGGWLVANPQHFSGGFLGFIDIDSIATEMSGFVQGRSGLEQPVCPDEDSVRGAGIKVTSDGGDRVRWCIGQDEQGLLLKLGSDLRVFTQVTFPETWSVEDTGIFSISSKAGIRSLTSLMPVGRGNAVRIIDGGDTLLLRIPPGSSGTVTAEMSVAAWALEGAVFGAEAFVHTSRWLNKNLHGEAKTRAEKLRRLLQSDAGDEYSNLLLDCLLDITSLSENLAVKDSALDALEFGAGCGGDYMKQALKGTVRGIAGRMVSTVAMATSAVLTAAHLLIAGVRELWDTAASFAGEDDVLYDIDVLSPRSSEQDEPQADSPCQPGLQDAFQANFPSAQLVRCDGAWARVDENGYAMIWKWDSSPDGIGWYFRTEWGFECKESMRDEGAPEWIIDALIDVCGE